jgi:hypothetical protein
MARFPRRLSVPYLTTRQSHAIFCAPAVEALAIITVAILVIISSFAFSVQDSMEAIWVDTMWSSSNTNRQVLTRYTGTGTGLRVARSIPAVTRTLGYPLTRVELLIQESVGSALSHQLTSCSLYKTLQNCPRSAL